jgi:hypothetical protein
MAMTVVMYPPGLERLDRDIEREVWEVTKEVREDAFRYAAKDTWEMATTIRPERRPGRRARVWVGNGRLGYYWATVEYGSVPHVIRPKYKKALYWPGALHPVRKVNHPGTPSQPFMRRALFQPRIIGPAGRG